MTKSPITLQELRRRIYVKAKTEKSWRSISTASKMSWQDLPLMAVCP